MSTYHSVADVLKQVQYVEEVTFGTTPVSPTFLNVGGVLSLSDTTEITAKRYRVLGSEDIYQGLRCGELHSFEIKYNPSTTTFPRYGTELVGGGAGSIDKSLSLLVAHRINNVENFTLYKGAKTDKIEFEVTPDDMVVTHNFLCTDITTPSSTHGLTTPVFASNFSGTPLCAPDTGTNPLTINSLTYPCLRFHSTISRNLDARQVIGNANVAFIVPTVRDIDIDFDILQKDTVTLSDVKTLTARTWSFQINATGPKTLSGTKLQLESREFEMDSESKEVFMESFSGFAQTATLTV